MNYKSDDVIMDEALLSDFEQMILERKPFYPRFLEIFLTDSCNHKCPFCISADYRVHKKNLPLHVFKRTMIEAFDGGTTSVRLCGGGEPLSYPAITEVLEFTKANGFFLNLITNGHFIRGHISDLLLQTCREIRISVDAGNAESYALSHGVDPKAFDRLLSNIGSLIAARNGSTFPVVELSFVAGEENLPSLPSFLRIAGELSVDRVNITMNTNYDLQRQKEMMLKANELVSAAEGLKVNVFVHDSPPDDFVDSVLPCPAVILHGLVNSEGFYYPSCHHLRRSEFIMGKLNESTGLKDILESSEFMEKQLRYIFGKGPKLKKMTHKMTNVLLMDHLLKSGLLKARAAEYLC